MNESPGGGCDVMLPHLICTKQINEVCYEQNKQKSELTAVICLK